MLSASFAIANRDPSRNNYKENARYDAATKTWTNMPKAETLYDYELGYTYSHRRFQVGLNLYFMDYDNQLVLTGEYNDVGSYKTMNVKDSYRMGAELTTAVKITDWFRWEGNMVISRNKLQHYKQYIDLYERAGSLSAISENAASTLSLPKRSIVANRQRAKSPGRSFNNASVLSASFSEQALSTRP